MSFLGGLTGADAERQLGNQRRAINEGRDAANTQYTQGEASAQDYMRPFQEQGRRAFTTYNDTLGVNGTGARDAAQSSYLSDPILQKQLALQQRNRGWSSNARGGYGSGTDALAASRVNLQGYGDWQNRLGSAGQQGQAAAGQGAQTAQWAAGGRAGADTNAANGLASSYGQSATNANTFAQNLIGVGGLAVSAATGRPYGSNNLSSRSPYPQQSGYPYDGVQRS